MAISTVHPLKQGRYLKKMVGNELRPYSYVTQCTVHEFLAKIAVEVMDGVIIHQLLGKLKAGDIPADVRVAAINALVDNYFVKGTVVTKGYPMEMRYAGPGSSVARCLQTKLWLQPSYRRPGSCWCRRLLRTI